MQQYRGEPAFTGVGISAMVATLVIWVAFLLSMRAQGGSELTPSDLALMRFGMPALFFLPLLIRRRKYWINVQWRHLLMILMGGIPFFYLVSLGSEYAPAAHAGALVPGTAPLFVTGLAVLVFRETLSRRRAAGLTTIAIGVFVLLGWALMDLSTGYWKGHLAFLGASVLWAFYTLGLRVSGLSASEATALLCVGSLLGVVFLLGTHTTESNLLQVSWSQLWPFLLAQGVGAGIVGGFTYGIAIRELGAEKTAALGSFTPALAALAAIPLLGEQITPMTIAGITLIMAGVIMASGIRIPSLFLRRSVAEN